ncbi:MAG TPA: isoprenylcysteine carboxylmethyltransferase family protein [Candidatus Dojkabacteria bacterium]|jgi:protein-S-isoprenylcysteine O-methyltransferase Ste14
MSILSIILVLIQISSIGYLIISDEFISSDPIIITVQVIGTLLLIWSMVVMRFRVNVFPEVLTGSKLVTEGPYFMIRHPMYLSLIILAVSFLMINFNIVRFIVFIIFIINLWVKIMYEEKQLEKEFQDYGHYKKRTKALIPFVI